MLGLIKGHGKDCILTWQNILDDLESDSDFKWTSLACREKIKGSWEWRKEDGLEGFWFILGKQTFWFRMG